MFFRSFIICSRAWKIRKGEKEKETPTDCHLLQEAPGRLAGKSVQTVKIKVNTEWYSVFIVDFFMRKERIEGVYGKIFNC